MDTTGVRLKILGDDEIEALYGLPHFNDDERYEYYTLSPTEKVALEQLHSIKSRIYFILQLGYFQSHHMFFVFDLPEVAQDARYVQEHHFPEFRLDDLDVTKVTRLRQQGLILDLFRYHTCDAGHRQALAEKAQQAVRVSAKPVFVFRELIHFLKDQRKIYPSFQLSSDGIHPSDLGHLLMAQLFLSGLGMPVQSNEFQQANELEQALLIITSDPLFPLIDKRRELRSSGWLPYVGYTREESVRNDSIEETEMEAAALQERINQIKFR